MKARERAIIFHSDFHIFQANISEDVHIDRKVQNLIVSRDILDNCKVDITLPKEGDSEPDRVVISGEEKAVADCRNHLLKLEEEYAKVKGKQVMKSNGAGKRETMIQAGNNMNSEQTEDNEVRKEPGADGGSSSATKSDATVIHKDGNGTQTIVESVNVELNPAGMGKVIAEKSEDGNVFVAVEEADKLFEGTVQVGLSNMGKSKSIKSVDSLGSTSATMCKSDEKKESNKFAGYACKHCQMRHPKLKDHHAHQAICQGEDTQRTEENRVKVLQTEADKEKEMRRMREELESKEQELIVLRSKNQKLSAKIHEQGILERKIRSQEMTIRFLRENAESLNARLEAALNLIANNENDDRNQENKPFE